MGLFCPVCPVHGGAPVLRTSSLRGSSVIKKRTFCFLLCLLVSGAFLFSQAQKKETVTIASFNIRIFSTGSRDDYELHHICMLLKEYDFIAIQEVKDLEILERTVSILNTSFGLSYNFVVSPELSAYKA